MQGQSHGNDKVLLWNCWGRPFETICGIWEMSLWVALWVTEGQGSQDVPLQTAAPLSCHLLPPLLSHVPYPIASQALLVLSFTPSCQLQVWEKLWNISDIPKGIEKSIINTLESLPSLGNKTLLTLLTSLHMLLWSYSPLFKEETLPWNWDHHASACLYTFTT